MKYHPLATAMPVFSLFSLNILGKLGFGALGGFEYVAILAGECRSPRARLAVGHGGGAAHCHHVYFRHERGPRFRSAGSNRFDRAIPQS
jgi:hypothetical protein